MKVLPFTLLIPDGKSMLSERVELPHFYQHMHHHNEYEIIWVEQGEGTLLVGNNMHSFRSGDIFLIGANVPHVFKSNPEYFTMKDRFKVKACSLYFNLSGILSGLFQLPEMHVLRSFLNQNKQGFQIPGRYTVEIANLMLQLHNASGVDVLLQLLSLLNQLKEMSPHLLPLSTDVYSSDLNANEGVRFDAIINYIMQNFNSQITLEDVAHEAHMTPQAFCRYFKKHTGNTFVTFLNEIRINDACKSLLTGKHKDRISGVAYQVGFNSLTNFNRAFKSVVGQSPKAYINAYHHVSKVSSLATV
jgi:AraC-like DNA-binding protein